MIEVRRYFSDTIYCNFKVGHNRFLEQVKKAKCGC